MVYRLNSDITIGAFRFGGVNEVRVRRSIHGFVETATIKVPSKCRTIDKNGKASPDSMLTSKQFDYGDHVSIKLGYNGEYIEEFRGFVKNFNFNTPLEIECEGYSYQLRRTPVNGSWKTITVEALLREAVKGTDVKLNVVHNPELTNVLLTNETGTGVIEYIKKQTGNMINIFFIKPDTLYVGLPYLPSGDGIVGVLDAKEVKLRLGWNVIKDNSLVQRIPNNEVIIRAKIKKTKRQKSDLQPATADRIKTYLLQHLHNEGDLKKLVDSEQRRINYTGYEGKITGFLVPFAEPGYKAFITDSRFKERDGVYFIESTEVVYGRNGARRVYEIGPKIQT